MQESPGATAVDSSYTSNVPAFLTKLWTLVEDPETNHLICWSAVSSSGQRVCGVPVGDRGGGCPRGLSLESARWVWPPYFFGRPESPRRALLLCPFHLAGRRGTFRSGGT